MRASTPDLTIIGDVGIDVVMGPVGGWPKRGTEALVDQAELRPGFSAANAALAARHLGAGSRLVGTVGADGPGQWLIDNLDGMDARLEIVSQATTMTVALMHDDAERSFLTTRGHLDHSRWDDFAKHLPLAEEPAIALLTGVFLMPLLARDYVHVLSEVRARGYRVAVDTGWPPQGWDGATCDRFRHWLGLCDYLLLNEIEVTGCTGRDSLEWALADLAGHLTAQGVAVAKAGERGALAHSVGKQTSAPAPRLDVFDTVGAGDSFNAGFLLSIGRGAELTVALETGCRTASAIISQFPRSQISPGALEHLLP